MDPMRAEGTNRQMFFRDADAEGKKNRAGSPGKQKVASKCVTLHD
jgi:hypothetical protein